FDYMFSLLKSNDITEENILTIHRLLYCGIDLEAAGVYRTEPVMVSGSNYPVSAPGEIESNMKQFIIWLKNERKKYHPIIFAAELHRRFVFIHPFLDGNGRTARLLMNTALIQTGYLPCVISPYIRSDYISALELSHKEPSRFQAFIAETELETEKDFMRNLNLNLPNFKEAQEP
ncbi:Fic family protein, partial [[Clostridium] symbiosum]